MIRKYNFSFRLYEGTHALTLAEDVSNIETADEAFSKFEHLKPSILLQDGYLDAKVSILRQADFILKKNKIGKDSTTFISSFLTLTINPYIPRWDYFKDDAICDFHNMQKMLKVIDNNYNETLKNQSDELQTARLYKLYKEYRKAKNKIYNTFSTYTRVRNKSYTDLFHN